MRVLLTGGTGFVGGRVAEALAASGHEVRLLARQPAAAGPLPAGCTAVPGDMLDRGSLQRALAGTDAVVHAAALVRRWVRDPSRFDRVNVDATVALFDLAREAGAGRVVYCSSFMALGPTDGATGDEDTVHDGRPRNDYERTKCRADRLARARQAAGEPLVVVYPGVVYGPGRLTGGNILAGVARDVMRGRFPGTVGPGDRRQCLACVDDVARGFVLALERAAPGSRYVLGGENVTVARAVELIATAAGMAAPRRRIPYAVAGALGWFLRRLAPWTGKEPILTDGEVEIYRHEWAYSSARAVRDLGYTVTPAADGLGRMVAWLRAGGGRE
jgi:NAD+-dependent farnesol dehydrogenase